MRHGALLTHSPKIKIMAKTIQATAYKNSTVIWHDPTDWEIRSEAILVTAEEYAIIIRQGEDEIQFHPEMIDDIIKFLKSLK